MSKQGNMEFHPILVPDLKGGRQARKEMSLEELWHAQNNFLFKGWTWKHLSKKEMNNLSYSTNFNTCYNTLMNLFKWKLDKQFSRRVLEMSAIDTGWVGAIEGIGGKFILPGKPTNILTLYGDPKQWRWHGVGGCGDTGLADCVYPYEDYDQDERKKALEKADWRAVVMRDNDLGYPMLFYVMKYAYLMTDLERSFNVASQRLKSPRIVVADNNVLKGDLKDYKEAFEDNDEMFIQYKNVMSNGQLPVEEVKSNTINPQILSELKEGLIFIFDKFLEEIGVNTNPNPDKAEYTSVTEQGSNNQFVKSRLAQRLERRKEWCENLKMIGIKASVEINEPFIEELVKEVNDKKNAEKEGKEDGKED